MATDEDFFDDDADEFESAAENPSLVAAAAALASETAVPTLSDPLDGPVTLPAGFRRVVIKNGETTQEVIRKAWVKELNGEDEERIAKAKLRDDGTAFLNAILECGLERLGDETPTKDDVDRLTLGDRDFLLMEIARVTYGNDLEYEDFVCPHCRELISFTVHLDEDVPVKRLDSLDDLQFEVRLKNDRVAKVTLPTVDVAVSLREAKTDAEANTALIAACVSEIRGPKGTVTISGDHDAARKLGIKDRQALIAEMSERMPGPQYNEVRFKHSGDSGCGEEIRLTVTLPDLFPSL